MFLWLGWPLARTIAEDSSFHLLLAVAELDFGLASFVMLIVPERERLRFKLTIVKFEGRMMNDCKIAQEHPGSRDSRLAS